MSFRGRNMAKTTAVQNIRENLALPKKKKLKAKAKGKIRRK